MNEDALSLRKRVCEMVTSLFRPMQMCLLLRFETWAKRPTFAAMVKRRDVSSSGAESSRPRRRRERSPRSRQSKEVAEGRRSKELQLF